VGLVQVPEAGRGLGAILGLSSESLGAVYMAT
jgi:hypothetical protein